jgi:MutS domain V
MNSKDLLAFYRNRKTTFSASLAQISKKIDIISNLRLTVALGFIAATYFAFAFNQALLYTLPLLMVLFIWLVFRHATLFKQKVHLENLVLVNDRELKALAGDYKDFYSGAAFIDPSHAYSHDLDLFGEGSFFQAINRCNTIQGRKDFAHALSFPFRDKTDILAQQAAIKELSQYTDFRQHVAAAGHETEEQDGDHEELFVWLKQKPFLYGSKVFQYLLIVIPMITLAAVLGSYFNPWVKGGAILLALFQWTLLGVYIKRINAFHESISRKKSILEKYGRVLHFLQPEKFTSAILSKLVSDAQQADRKLKHLASLVGSFNARSNALTSFFVNSVLMYDLQYVYRLEKWKTENEHNLRQWLDAVRKIEVLCTWATYAFNHQKFIFADINDQLVLKATGLGHPLISSAECVTNDVKAGDDGAILIITGANMAGKSTFLRTIGINVVIALNGAPVFATEFKCPLILLRTGMRTADSLKDHQSYFYAELNRLKSIVDQLRNKLPLLILLDEILKGTNSTDKQAGSIALVKQLIPHQCLALIATHDLALGELENDFPHHVKNFHFEPNIENDQLTFDYKLKRGIAEKMNATFLMKKMGIIPT